MWTDNSAIDSGPLNEMYEYILVAHPDAQVSKKITKERDCFFHEFGGSGALATDPHIVIAHFYALEAMERTIARWLHQIVSGIESFSLTLDGYAGLPSHAICVHVHDQTILQQFEKKLIAVKEYINDCHCPAPNFVKKFHFTIAEDLTKDMYNKAITYCMQKELDEQCMIEELVLLRRVHQYNKFQSLQIFRFRPAKLPIHLPQLMNYKTDRL